LVIGEVVEEGVEAGAGADVVGGGGFGNTAAVVTMGDGKVEVTGDDEDVIFGDVEEVGDLTAVLRLGDIEAT
jgi:hypothetical protein